MATKPLNSNPVADLPENWTTGQTVAPTGLSVGLSAQHGYNYLMGKVNESLADIGTINDAFETTVPSPANITPSAVAGSGAKGSSTDYARADHVHALSTDASPTSASTNPVQSGGVYTALAGKAAKGDVLTATLAANAWSSNQQTVTVAGVPASGYAYIITPDPSCFSEWTGAGVYADEITTDDTVTFNCLITPSVALTAIILKVQVNV